MPERVFDGDLDGHEEATMGIMRVLDETGDTMLEWHTDDPASVARAREAFARERCRRRLAFARPTAGGATEAVQVRTFDPTAEEIIWVRPIAGG